MDRIPIFIHENKQLSTHIIRDITCLAEAFSLRHFYRPIARPALRDSLRPPVGRSARVARTTGHENKNGKLD